MKKNILCLVILCLAIFTPAMGDIQIISETVAKGNGTVYADVQTSQVNVHDEFVALTPGGLVYESQVNGQNVSTNATDVISQKLEMGMKGMQSIRPLRDPFKIQVPEAFKKI